jgi:hypothetical protein
MKSTKTATTIDVIYSAVSVDIVVIVSLPAGQIGLPSTAVVAVDILDSIVEY